MSSPYGGARTQLADLLNNQLVRLPFLPENPHEHRNHGAREDHFEGFSRHSVKQKYRNHDESSARRREVRRRRTCASPNAAHKQTSLRTTNRS